MKHYLIYLIVLIIDFNLSAQINSDEIDIHHLRNKNLFVGEDLTYVVKYAFLNLGEVRFRVLEQTELNNTPVYKTIANIDSYPDLPFVSLHQIYESYIDSSLFPIKFFAKIFGDDSVFVDYKFIGKSEIDIQKGKVGSAKLWLDTTVYINQRTQDGLSILYFARMNFSENKNLVVPCFVNEKKEKATLNFYSESVPVSIDSVDYEIDCRYLNGFTDFVSVYGLTGNFEGWFSNDKYSVPIRAKMNVIIGSINLELIKWNEKIWNPPLFKN